MKKMMVIAVVALAAMLVGGAASAEEKEKGATLYKKYCEVCHPNGGNIINPQKTLSKKALETRNIKGVKDVVRVMRNPGPGMTRFDEKMIPEKEAKLIAEYMLKQFK